MNTANGFIHMNDIYLMIPTDGEPPGGSGFVESPCLHLQHAVARQHPGCCKHHLSESVRREGDLFLPTDSRYPNWEKLGETHHHASNNIPNKILISCRNLGKLSWVTG